METTTIIDKKEFDTIDNFGILPEIQNLNFDRIKHKMALKESLGWSEEKINLAEREYKRYLTLIKLHINKRIVPSKLMDEFWHMHILDTKSYREDCQQIFNRFIDHFPYFGIYGQEDHQNLLNEFEETKKMYQSVFNTEIGDAFASRCEDHACHVVTECACRVEGACK
ncbi:hypothetical protein [Dokdonia sp.]|uniref:glycine-rich domain-containing protein n=1 Tax=Dokdonia sp. TaxID=2024995 RepID=UPI0032650C43